MKHFALVITLFLSSLLRAADAPAVVHLWPNGAPGFEDRKDLPEKITGTNVSSVHNPSLTVYLPPKESATGVALLICPGGGHSNLAIEHEG